ncbi:MAG TPA: GreA/GreB family elongation factor [Rectinemataceae bacterium]
MNGILLLNNDLKRLKALVKALREGRRHETAHALAMRVTALEDMERQHPGVSRAWPGTRVELLNIDSGERYSYTLVYPGSADGANGYISVLTPLGSALLGREEGERFSYMAPGGMVRMELVELGSDD